MRKMFERSAQGPAEVMVTINRQSGRENLEDMMLKEISRTIKKVNRRSARTGGSRMAYLVKLV